MPKHGDKSKRSDKPKRINKDVNMTPVEDKENIPPGSKKTKPQPGTFYGRFHKPEKASHLLIMEGNDSAPEEYQEQFFDSNVDTSFYRALKKPKLKSQPLTPIDNNVDNNANQENNAPNSAQKQPRPIPEAFTPNGTKMVSRREFDVRVSDSETKEILEGRVLMFSPPERRYDKKRKRSDEKPTRPDSKPAPAAKKPLLFTDIKGGNPTLIELTERNRKKAKSQKKTMGHTAKEALLNAIANGKDKYEASVLATLRSLEEQVFMEWLHCLAFSLCPKEIEPQDPNNLGAGPDYINTCMMALERLAAFFAKTYPNATVTVLPYFKMLEDSQVIKEIEYKVTIVQDTKTFEFSNKINVLALSNPSNWPSCSDGEQLQLVAKAMLDQNSAKPQKMDMSN